jgi:hypothetical protein
VTSAKIKKNAVTPSKMSDYTDSGLVKLNNGKSKVLLQRGPFEFTPKCVDDGGDSSTASLTVKNTGSTTALFESEDEGNYDDPLLEPGAPSRPSRRPAAAKPSGTATTTTTSRRHRAMARLHFSVEATSESRS